MYTDNDNLKSWPYTPKKKLMIIESIHRGPILSDCEIVQDGPSVSHVIALSINSQNMPNMKISDDASDPMLRRSKPEISQIN